MRAFFQNRAVLIVLGMFILPTVSFLFDSPLQTKAHHNQPRRKYNRTLNGASSKAIKRSVEKIQKKAGQDARLKAKTPNPKKG